MFFIFVFLFLNFSFAETPDDSDIYTVIVEAHQDYEVYIPKTKIINNSDYDLKDFSFTFDLYYSYISSFKSNAKYKNERGTFEPITMSDRKINIYNSDTIGYVWENCNYKLDYRKCSIKNSHYFVESILVITNNEIIFNLSLYDQDLQVISRGSSSSKIKIKHIPEVTYKENTQPQSVTNNCFGSVCATPTTTPNQVEKIEHKEVTIEPSLYSSDIYQASIALWLGVRLQ